MSIDNFDWVAVIRALLLGLASNLLVTGIGFFITGRKAIGFTIGCGIMLIITIFFFYSWPELIAVPDLSNLSRAEAEVKLERRQLAPESRPQYSTETPAGLVIFGSQEPAPGIKVRKGEVVKFAVALASARPETALPTTGPIALSMHSPSSQGSVTVHQYADGTYHYTVKGICQGLSSSMRLLLWVKPVNPPSETPGWYLQREPVNGINQVNPDGSWEGIGQIGNAIWPPRTGDILDIAVTAVPDEIANNFLSRTGVITSISLPGEARAVANGVRVEVR